MKKDAYYFPHYSNARNDVKLLKLRRVLGLEGYGIYFCLLEILRDQTDFRYPLSGLSELEFELRVPKEKISTVIMDYELFEVDKTGFFSPKLVQYLMPYIEKTERARLAAQKRWSDANAHANALHLDMQGEERIGENRREEDIKRRKFSDDFWKTKEQAFEDIKTDELFIEESQRTITQKGWRGASKIHTAIILKAFLIAKADLNKPKSDIRQHFKNFLFAQNINKLRELADGHPA